MCSFLAIPGTRSVGDYALTTIGLKPFFPDLMERFKSRAVYKDNWKGTLNMGRLSPESMRELISYVNKEYGGVEGYFAKMTTLEPKVPEMVRNALLVPMGT